ncbi:hypothetical protein RND71_034010 [Anisodus tanguticus]|uniref:Uncharacterized protein n=1 Tax=Anisodus tanguticus TaxID=243964 RepID=A0AAE1R9C0_9SOLA|nr:hypothetical protein RND71_034010 [Anisodus tanguticus]
MSPERYITVMDSVGEVGDEIQPRSYWRWSKQDFFPEDSFQNWSAYRSALLQTFTRFKDRVISCSEDADEIGELRKQSENEMKRCLKFAVEIPVAGGPFAYIRVELGDFAAFITAGNIILGSIAGNAEVARAWTSYFTTLLNRHPNSLRIHTNLTDGFNLLDPIAVAVLVITSIIAVSSTKRTYFNWIASAINMVVILFVIIAGFAHANTSNLTPFMPHGAKEETKNPSKDIPLGLLGSMSIITVIYCLMALSLSMMQKYTDIDPNAAYSVAFQSVGMKWAKYLVALGALKGMTTVLLAGAIGQARYATHIARVHMIPPWFAPVHPKTGTPINATLLIGLASACIVFFSSLDVLASLLSVKGLLLSTMVAVALLVRRYYVRGITPRTNLLKLTFFVLVITVSSVGTCAYWGLNPNGWLGYTVTVPLWFLATLAICVLLPQERTSKVWGVPLVPIPLNCNKLISHGIIRSSGIYKVWHIYGCDADLLYSFWAPCNL